MLRLLDPVDVSFEARSEEVGVIVAGGPVGWNQIAQRVQDGGGDFRRESFVRRDDRAGLRKKNMLVERVERRRSDRCGVPIVSACCVVTEECRAMIDQPQIVVPTKKVR